MAVPNTLAYYDTATNMAVKSFELQAQVLCIHVYSSYKFENATDCDFGQCLSLVLTYPRIISRKK
jgi:hypothetical protein